ncbi:MAG: hypothetical protein GX862_06215, partial [Leucobacter sp.]|nr:hypothetical protein [Leucobacter sp.]
MSNSVARLLSWFLVAGSPPVVGSVPSEGPGVGVGAGPGVGVGPGGGPGSAQFAYQVRVLAAVPSAWVLLSV